MEEKEGLKVYHAPKIKVAKIGITNILCGSHDDTDEVNGASTEKLKEEHVFGSIW